MMLFKKLILSVDRAIQRVSDLLLLISGLLMIIMSLLSSYGVFRRYVLHSPEPYSYELNTIFLVACVVLSIAGVQKFRRQLRVDFIANFLPKGFQEFLLNVLSALLGLFAMVLLTRYSWDTAWHSLIIGETSQSVWKEPLFPTKVVVPIGSAVLCLVLVSQIVHSIILLIRGIKDSTN